MHRLTALLVPVVFFCRVTAPAAAQQPGDSMPERWDVSAEFSYTDQTGNRVLRLLTAGLNFSHLREEDFELDGTLEGRYGESEGEVVARSQRATLTFDLHPREVWSPFLFTQAERDEFKRLDLRFSGGAGAKYTLHRRPDGEASLSAALLLSHERFDQLPADPAAANTTRARWSVRLRGSRQLRDGLTAQHTTFYQPVWDEVADYLLRSETGVKLLLMERLALSVEYQWDRDSDPPAEVRADDRLLKTGLIIEF